MRIVVTGTSGAGKTTLARRIAADLDISHIELDAINWQPGWHDISRHDPALFARRVTRATDDRAWVADGNYGQVRDILWQRATHLIWLDYDRPVVMARVIRRSFARALLRPELWPGTGNRETWRRWLRPSHPVRWAWDTWARRRADTEARLALPANAHLRVLRLRRPQDARNVAAWLEK
jgi:adenylate kinase family enzyme